MPKLQHKEKRPTLQPEEIKRAWDVARSKGPFPAALFAWMYEFGARADEPGKQELGDVNLRSMTGAPIHLKHGRDAEPHALLRYCRAALPEWLKARPDFVLRSEQREVLFPSRCPGICGTCHGRGKRRILRLNKETGKRALGEETSCHHCDSTGKRWGVSRFEVYHLTKEILGEAKVPVQFRYPHILRHSIVSHLLEGGISPSAIQQRVGHQNLATTLSYAGATRRAAAQMEAALAGVYGEDEDS